MFGLRMEPTGYAYAKRKIKSAKRELVDPRCDFKIDAICFRCWEIASMSIQRRTRNAQGMNFSVSLECCLMQSASHGGGN